MNDAFVPLTEELSALARLTRSLAHKAHHDVSAATGAVLAIVEACPGVRTKEIASRLGVGLSVASRQTAELVQSGLLRRDRTRWTAGPYGCTSPTPVGTASRRSVPSVPTGSPPPWPTGPRRTSPRPRSCSTAS